MKKSKRSPILWLLIVLLMLTSLPLSVLAEEEKTSGNLLKFQLDNKTCIVNGSMVTMDVAPTSVNGRTLIPVVYVANPLGAKVDWDGSTKKVTIVLKNTTLELWIGNATAKVNGADTPIDPANAEVKPIILSGRTMLPLRFVAEKLGCDVAWDAATKGITISEKIATANAGGAEKTDSGLARPDDTRPNIGSKNTLIGQTPGTPETKPSEGKPKETTKEDTKDLEERIKKIRTGFKPGTEKAISYHPEGFGIYFQRKNDVAEVFYTLDELSIERNALREKSKSGSLTDAEKANLAELDQVVPVGIQKMKQMYYDLSLKTIKEFAKGEKEEGKSAEDRAAEFAKSIEKLIDAYYSRTLPPSPSPEGYTRYYYADWFITEDKIGPFTLEELLKVTEYLKSEKSDALIKQAKEDRIKQLREKGMSEPEIARTMRALAPPRKPGWDEEGNDLYDFEYEPGEFDFFTCDELMRLRYEMQQTEEGRELLARQKDIIEKAWTEKTSHLNPGNYYFEYKPGEYKVCFYDELLKLRQEMLKTEEGRKLLEKQKDIVEKALAFMGEGNYFFEFKPGEYKVCSYKEVLKLRQEMLKTEEGRKLLERQKDIIDQAIEYVKKIFGGNEEKITKYLDQFEDVPSWVRNNKKVAQNLSDANKALEVVKHLGKGYDIINSNYGESNGVRQPVLDMNALYQYNFLHQSPIMESTKRCVDVVC